MDESLYRGFDERAHKFFTHLTRVVDTKHPSRVILRRHFMREVRRRLPLSTRDEIRLAKVFDFSFTEHDATKPRDSGEAYIFHLVRASLVMVWMQDLFKVYDLEVIVDVLLHDCFEEDWETAMSRLLIRSRVAVRFGLETASDVYALTKHKERGETNEEYCGRLGTTTKWRVIASKLVDRIDNMWTIDAVSEDRRFRKILETEMWFQFICQKLRGLIEDETRRKRLKPYDRWQKFGEFLITYLWYAVDTKRRKYHL